MIRIWIRCKERLKSLPVRFLKDKLSGTEAFLRMKGILEEFKEFIRSKSLQEKLALNQKKVEEAERERPKDEIKRKRDIAF